MRYFANPTSNPKVHEAMATGQLGFIDTPAQGNARLDGVTWCADNGAYSDRFDERKWWKFLTDNAHAASTCAFAVAPDVVGDAVATLERSRPWLPKIRTLGYPAAFVAQNGLESLTVPWDELDVLFIGGTLECRDCGVIWPTHKKPKRRQPCLWCGRVMRDWKDSRHAASLIAEAKARGKGTHAGRVNSQTRYLHFLKLGCDSADGTFLTYGPDVNLPRLIGWTRLAAQGDLFGGAA